MTKLRGMRDNNRFASKKKNNSKPIIPEYSMNGKTLRPERKERNKRLAIIGAVFAVILAFLYLPQFVMPDESDVGNAEVTIDSNSIRMSNNALRDNPSADFDKDGLENSKEISLGTNPWFIDSDGDGATDFCELNVSNTSPTQSDSIVLDTQIKQDEQKDKNVGSPYKVGNVILWADDYESKAYGSVIDTTTGYRFCNFDGFAQFPNSEGMSAYKVENGVHSLLPYRAEENVWEVSAGDSVELYDEKLKEIVEINLFSFPIYLDKNAVTSVLDFILPDKGFITAQTKAEMDVEPDTRENITTNIEKTYYDELDNSRFTINSNTLNDLLFVRESISVSESCVAVSLFNEDKGEFIGIVYGYTCEGDLLIADKTTYEPIGVLKITEMARKIMDKTGTLVSYNYFDFSGFGFNSLNGDRISFFAASSDAITESDFGIDTQVEAEVEVEETTEAETEETEVTENPEGEDVADTEDSESGDASADSENNQSDAEATSSNSNSSTESDDSDDNEVSFSGNITVEQGVN